LRRPSHYKGLSPVFRIIPLLYRSIERIHIDMDDLADGTAVFGCHNLTLIYAILLRRSGDYFIVLVSRENKERSNYR
jgi:hypothetical protein